MQPYQQASAALREREETPLRALKTAGKFALSGGAASIGAGIAGKVIPFLSKYIPENLAIKGLTKVDPRFGKFISTALNAGQSFDEVRDFIKEKYEGSETGGKEQPKEDRNIIEQYSPELNQFMLQQIKGGRPPMQAGLAARSQEKFSKQIKQMEKDHKTPWSQILQSIYGMDQAQSQQAEPVQQQPEPQQNSTSGQGQEALIAALQKVAQLRGGR